MLPNDDLDLQVVWACVLDKMETPTVDRHVLAQAWLDHVEFPYDEYGMAIRNLKNGLHPPLSGSYDNWFANGMGAPIRSEVWACLAPGNPELAAAYAYEDACVDHAGEGVWGEVFLAALESAAFIESDPYVLIGLALSFLPTDSLTRQAVEGAVRYWRQNKDWLGAREHILDTFGHENFTDAPMNIAFTVLGWLAGEGNFSRAICIAVNCGKDTDCTGATVGALMGILDPDCIPDKWLTPIGRTLVVSPEIKNLEAPPTLDQFTDLIVALRDRLDQRMPAPRVYLQSTESLAIPVQISFVDSMPEGQDAPSLILAKTVILPGTVGELTSDRFEGKILLIRYEFEIPADGNVRVMFNTRVDSRVWIDGLFAFGRSEGPMAPSLHRAPSGQIIVKDMSAGKHELIAALRCPALADRVEWVIGVGVGNTAQWFPKAFAVSDFKSAPAGSIGNDDIRTQLPAPTTSVDERDSYRILVIGASISRHGFDAGTIARLGWGHTAGMAASSESNDFAHLLAAKIGDSLDGRPVTLKFNAVCDGTTEQRVSPMVKEITDSGYEPDLVIFDHGGHEDMSLGAEGVSSTYNAVLDFLESLPSRPTIVCLGNWDPDGFVNNEYTGWSLTVEQTMRETCARRNVRFVPVYPIVQDPACRGWGKSPGVQWHPNDLGHARYAEAIFSVVRPLLPSS
jgi:ADP-ribosylglycohydrolase